jgi:hypothetical protein
VNNAQITGATTNVLTISGVDYTNAGNYTIAVFNSAGGVTSSPPPVLIVTNPAPIFLTQPQGPITNLFGTAARFSATVTGAAPFGYRWQRNGADLSSDPKFIGSTSNILTITWLDYMNAGNYTIIVTNSAGAITNSPAATLVVTNIGILARWDFNAVGLNPTNPAPSAGSVFATAGPVGITNSFLTAGTPGGSPFDPITSVLGATNYYWGNTLPAQGTLNKRVGVQFKVSTAGLRKLSLNYDTRASATGSEYQRLQYTTNGVTFLDYPTSMSFANAPNWEGGVHGRQIDLTSLPGARDNTNFAIRIVAEFDSTANYEANSDDNYLAAGVGTYGTSGTACYDIVNLLAETITNANTPPKISAFLNSTNKDNDGPVAVGFTVGDAETPDSLTVTAVSADHSVLSDPGITGSGASRTLTFTPQSGQGGVAPILVTVTDAGGESTMTWFYATINPANAAPTITSLPNTNMLANTSLTVSFTVADDTTPASLLQVAATSGNTALVPNNAACLTVTTNGALRTLTITPTPGASGIVPITVTVTDTNVPPASGSMSFAVMVCPSTSVVFNDSFDYDQSGNLTDQSLGFWQAHSSGGVGPITVASGTATMSGDGSEDDNAPLLGGPYPSSGTATLYSVFTLNCSDLPSSGGTYFAHFKDASTSGFGARVYASTLNAATGKFRLGIGNGSGLTNSIGQFAIDLNTGTNYTIVTRFAPSNGVATLWINPTSESSPSSTDITTGANPMPVVAYALRQAVGEGTMVLDNLKIGLSFSDVIPTAPAITADPQSLTNALGTDASFSVTAIGTAPLSYTWYFNTNTIIAGQNTANLLVPAVQLTNAGTYRVVVSNSLGAATSQVAPLTIQSGLPAIKPDPASRTNLVGSTATFTATATSTPAPSVFWLSSTGPIAEGGRFSGTATSTLSISNVQSADAGSYSMVASNSSGVVTSQVATLTVWVPPAISPDPQSRTNVGGTTATFTSGATGTPTPTVSWLKNSGLLSNGGNLSGATTSTLTVSNVHSADAGNYTMVATSAAGAATSQVAVLTFQLPPSPKMSWHQSGANFVLSWTDASGVFWLTTATNVSGPYTNVPSATNPYTNSVAEPRRFFRLLWQ